MHITILLFTGWNNAKTGYIPCSGRVYSYIPSWTFDSQQVRHRTKYTRPLATSCRPLTLVSPISQPYNLRPRIGLHACQSTIVYERRESAQVLYVVPVSSILGRLLLVPVGDTGTIPFQMRGKSADFPGASCDKTQGGRDGCRWWYVNRWATKQ